MRGFNQICRCRTHFSAERESLQQPKRDGENWRGDADGIVRWRERQSDDRRAMSEKETNMAGLRPFRSPRMPMTIPPRGRVKKPAPNVASERRRLEAGSREGKNVCPIWTAKNA